MATVIKVGIHHKLNKDMIVNFEFEHIVTDESDAEDLGYNDQKLQRTYAEGYTRIFRRILDDSTV